MDITKSIFGKLKDGSDVFLFTLSNDHNISVSIINFGGIITQIITPDKHGITGDIVLGFDKLEDYENEHPYLGAIVGRYANRIANGRFLIDGVEYILAVNNGPNHLHGGKVGFDKKLWTAFPEKKEDMVSLKLAYHSKHLEEGYPGNLMVEVEYGLNNDNELRISYKAETDQKTIINLTNHSYFNLNIKKGDILSHKARFLADFYAENDQNDIPTGVILPTENTAFDFSEFKYIGEDFDELEIGYDQPFIIQRKNNSFTWFARVEDDSSGRVLEAGTTEPGFQFYTSYYLNSVKGKKNRVYDKYHAFCLEAQHLPDSPNRPDFPATILEPGKQYHQLTVYKFSTMK
jgi:aldose 1-epimerase